jgi:hypothetical protein
MTMRGLLILAVIGVFGFPAPSAIAAPSYDIEAHCQRIAEFGEAFSRSAYGGCLSIEREASRWVDAEWSDLPQSVREHCNRVATFGGPGSYSTLKGCIEIELNSPSPKAPAQTSNPRIESFVLFGAPTSGLNGEVFPSFEKCMAARASAGAGVCVNRSH